MAKVWVKLNNRRVFHDVDFMQTIVGDQVLEMHTSPKVKRALTNRVLIQVDAPTTETTETEAKPPVEDRSSWNKDRIKTELDKLGIDYDDKLVKAELLALLPPVAE